MEFNPSTVDGYRLIGYENRVMAHEDFNDDTKDAGGIGVVRFKQPDGDHSSRIARIVLDTPRPMTANLGFASAVAEFGILLRGSEHAGSAGYAAVIDRARRYTGDDRHGYQAEFIGLAERAAQLARPAEDIDRIAVR